MSAYAALAVASSASPRGDLSKRRVGRELPTTDARHVQVVWQFILCVVLLPALPGAAFEFALLARACPALPPRAPPALGPGAGQTAPPPLTASASGARVLRAACQHCHNRSPSTRRAPARESATRP